MGVCSCGITEWVFWWIDLKSTKVSLPQLHVQIVPILFAGPVRAVAIHPTRALLASGGDDYKIKVWGEQDYTNARVLHLMQDRSAASKQTLSVYSAWSFRLRAYRRLPP